MSRDKQIEEMANIMKMSLDGLGNGTHNFTGFEISTMFAKALYNAGYRKVPEGAIVLTRAELDALNEYTEKLKREYAREIWAETHNIILKVIGAVDKGLGEAIRTDNEQAKLVYAGTKETLRCVMLCLAESQKKYTEEWK